MVSIDQDQIDPQSAETTEPGRSEMPSWINKIHPVPAFTNNFVQFQIFGWSFLLGMVALSLMFLAGYGGMVSLVQMTIAACAGYIAAIFGESAVTEISLGWPWWLAVPIGIGVAMVFGAISGALAVRTESPLLT